VARGRLVRNVAFGVGAAAFGAATSVAGVRVAARRLRGRPDPEAGEDLGSLPPDDLTPAVSFDGTELAVRAAGPVGAPTVIFSHGFSLDMTTWYYQWRHLSDRYRVVLFDYRGHGRSGRPPDGDFSLRSMGRDLRAVLDRAVPEGPAVIVGHSMGGMALLSFAEEFPEEFGTRVAGVVLADTAASDLVREALGDLGSRAERALRPLLWRIAGNLDRTDRVRRVVQQRGADLALLVARVTNFGPDASPSQVDHVSRLSASAPVEVWVHTARDLVDMDFREALANITVPALVVVGDRDLLTPKGSAEAMRDALPQGRAVAIARAGHVSMMERHRVFNEVLDGFLQEVLPAKPKRSRTRKSTRT
jgi:pimeloyl-ACP methyl ester carboxylesterase